MDELIFRAIALLAVYITFLAVLFLICLVYIHYTIKKNQMATKEQFQALIARIDAATNELAAEIRSLKDIIAGGGLSQEDEAQVLAGLDAVIGKLEQTGKEEVPPVTEPAPGTGGEEGTDTGAPTP